MWRLPGLKLNDVSNLPLKLPIEEISMRKLVFKSLILDLQWIQDKIDLGLEFLAIHAVQADCLNSSESHEGLLFCRSINVPLDRKEGSGSV